jgi:hypothetical protein
VRVERPEFGKRAEHQLVRTETEQRAGGPGVVHHKDGQVVGELVQQQRSTPRRAGVAASRADDQIQPWYPPGAA